jgi:hypothetical protein
MTTSPSDQRSAEANCVLLGGHLVSYVSYQEQLEVEMALVFSGGLIPSFHQFYWMGLQVLAYPQFAWSDTTLPLPTNRTYAHWAKGAPNQRAACAGASYPASWSQAWGWQDAECTTQAVAVCEAMCKLLATFGCCCHRLSVHRLLTVAMLLCCV